MYKYNVTTIQYSRYCTRVVLYNMYCNSIIQYLDTFCTRSTVQYCTLTVLQYVLLYYNTVSIVLLYSKRECTPGVLPFDLLLNRNKSLSCGLMRPHSEERSQ